MLRGGEKLVYFSFSTSLFFFFFLFLLFHQRRVDHAFPLVFFYLYFFLFFLRAVISVAALNSLVSNRFVFLHFFKNFFFNQIT